MVKIDVGKEVLENAWMELNFIKNRRFHEDVVHDIRWQDVEEQLQSLDRAIQEGNEQSIRDAIFILSNQLSNRVIVVRTIIGSELQDKTRPLPPPIWEHLNNIVSRLQIELSSDEPEAEKMLAAPDDRTC